MSEAIIFLGPALVMCLVIASIHVYLGMHVLEREVIFVDLSLAQLAALGATVASAMHVSEDGYGVHFAAFGFTAVGAALFALTGRARHILSQEAVVGIVYAVASAMMLLVLSQSPHGAEHIKSILVGSLLLTTWEQVGNVLMVYIPLAIVLGFLARRFTQISWDPGSFESARSLAWWDFGFYLLFGVVITISVQVAGILLVFSFLIVPAVITKLFTQKIGLRLILGWGVALAASMMGIAASWNFNLPTGATIVAAFGGLFIVAGFLRALGLGAPVKTAD